MENISSRKNKKWAGVFKTLGLFLISAAVIAAVMWASAQYGHQLYVKNQGYAFSERVGVAFSNASRVVDAIREGLKNHDTAIYISYESRDGRTDDMRAMTDELMKFALSETDDSKEGDYIRYQYGGYTLTYSREELEPDVLWKYRLRIVPNYYMDLEQDAEVDAEVERLLGEFSRSGSLTSDESNDDNRQSDAVRDGDSEINREDTGYSSNERDRESDREIDRGAETSSAQPSVQGLLSSLFGISGRQCSDYDKVRAVYDYLYDNVVYDTVRSNHRGYHLKTTAYAALIQHTAVCQGYSVAMYRLLRELGVDCRIITGMAEYDGVSEYHSWNIVKIDGVYYNIDPTWDRALNTHDYFLKSDASFADHVRDEQFATEAFYEQYPMAESDYTGES